VSGDQCDIRRIMSRCDRDRMREMEGKIDSLRWRLTELNTKVGIVVIDAYPEWSHQMAAPRSSSHSCHITDDNQCD
jgi:hypothetical protein